MKLKIILSLIRCSSGLKQKYRFFCPVDLAFNWPNLDPMHIETDMKDMILNAGERKIINIK